MIGNIAVEEPRRIVPGPKGIHDFSIPLSKNACFTEQGVRQWASRAYSGGNLPVPEGGKAKYDPRQQLLNEQSEQRENEFLGRYLTVSEDARNLLQQKFAMKGALREMENYQQLIHSGLTDEEANSVIRQKLVDKVASGAGNARADYHQKQKDVIAELAIRRNVRVGLPQSMATFAGVRTPEMNYSASEVAGIKRLLKHKIEKLDNQRKAESMTGQNFNMLPKINTLGTGWTANVPSANASVGILPAYDNNVFRQITQDPHTRIEKGVVARTREQLFPELAGQFERNTQISEELAEGARAVRAEETRAEQLARVASGSSSGGGNSSSSVSPALSGGERPAGSNSASGGGGGGGGKKRGPIPTVSIPASVYENDPEEFYEQLSALIGSKHKKDRSKTLQRQASVLGINTRDPSDPTGQAHLKYDEIYAKIKARYPSA
jgi:hypothetical protein